MIYISITHIHQSKTHLINPWIRAECPRYGKFDCMMFLRHHVYNFPTRDCRFDPTGPHTRIYTPFNSLAQVIYLIFSPRHSPAVWPFRSGVDGAGGSRHVMLMSIYGDARKDTRTVLGKVATPAELEKLFCISCFSTRKLKRIAIFRYTSIERVSWYPSIRKVCESIRN